MKLWLQDYAVIIPIKTVKYEYMALPKITEFQTK
jgi:hypothetical protein